MKIYLDYVFFINFLFDLILLFGISFILKRNTKLIRVILGSIFGGLSTFILFLSVPGIIYFILKILSGLIMIIITFSYKDIKHTFFNLIYLMILSVILGGTLYLLNIEIGYEHVGMIFFTNGSSVNMFILLLVSLLVIILYVRVTKKKNRDINYKYKVDLYDKDNVIKVNAYLDTGNNLLDPYFNKPISIINKSVDIIGTKEILVPFNTINGSGIMKCFFIDKIYIHNIGYRENILIGISEEVINIEGVDLILNKDLLEDNDDKKDN